MRKLVFVFQLMALAVGSAGFTQKQALPSPAHLQSPCPRDQEWQALDEYEKLKTWADIFRSFKRYGHCDDGAIAEGYSDKVVHLLATDWKTFSALDGLAKKDPAFRKFIIRHIDTTADTQELRSAQQNAHRRCPEEGKELCRVIDRQISRQLRLMHSLPAR